MIVGVELDTQLEPLTMGGTLLLKKGTRFPVKGVPSVSRRGSTVHSPNHLTAHCLSCCTGSTWQQFISLRCTTPDQAFPALPDTAMPHSNPPSLSSRTLHRMNQTDLTRLSYSHPALPNSTLLHHARHCIANSALSGNAAPSSD